MLTAAKIDFRSVPWGSVEWTNLVTHRGAHRQVFDRESVALLRHLLTGWSVERLAQHRVEEI